MNKVDFNVYLITDRQQVPAGRTLLQTVAGALDGGVRAIQLREKDLAAADLYPLALELRALTRRFGARLLINDRLDVALAVEADGVHLGGHSLPVAVARRLLGPEKLIGVSTHHPQELISAAAAGADFATFGPVFATPSKAAYGPPLGPGALKSACAAAPLPVFALGGIRPDHLPTLRSCGAHGIAVISTVIAAPDPSAAAARLL
ncbi:MAG: thiamine phosphate synthase [Deltaproteobacteria bacterium]|nr:MAG: thiamine phosphate synthase [Deltaproteobacteria bacterium]